MRTRLITIDGPAGAGKTTVSKLLARRLGCVYVDTGALYRGVAYEIGRQQIKWDNDDALESFLQSLDLNLVMEEGELALISSGKDITGYIRTPEISMLASSTSAVPRIREVLLDIQRSIGRTQDAVFEGRDMGTVVFPEASHKFFLYADLEIRARRRFEELTDTKIGIERVQKEMETRDTNDSQRESAPLKAAGDAIKIDSSLLSIEQVVDKMLSHIENT